MAPPPSLLLYCTVVLLILILLVAKGAAIDCFECMSVAGNNPACEDEFGPDNETESLLHRKCQVGYLKFQAFYCVKIKGVKENGDSIMIRTCSMDDWGSNCGSINIEQGAAYTDVITGCLASCDFDGCNHGERLTHEPWMVVLCGGAVSWLLRS